MRVRNGNKVNRMSHCDGLSVELNHLLRASPTRATIPAVLAGVPLAVCSQMFMPPQSLQVLLSRLCSQMLALPAVLAGAPLAVMPRVADVGSLHGLRRRLCSQMRAPPQFLHWLLLRLCWQMQAPPQSLHVLLWRLCSHFLRPLCGALSRCLCLPFSPPLPASPCSTGIIKTAPPCCRQSTPRGTRDTCPAATRARTFPAPLRLRRGPGPAPCGPAPGSSLGICHPHRDCASPPRPCSLFGPRRFKLDRLHGARSAAPSAAPCVSLFHVTDTGSPGSLGRLPVHSSSLL